MTCAEFKQNVHAYALGALDPPDLAACDAHLAESRRHQGCHEELARAFDAAALLAESLAGEQPAPSVWSAIERKINLGERGIDSTADAGKPMTSARRRASFRWRESLAWGLAAAAAVALILTNLALRDSQKRVAQRDQTLALARDQANAAARASEEQREICLRELATVRGELGQRGAALMLVQDRGTRLVPLEAQGEVPYRASAILNPAQRRALLLASRLAPQPGKDYELWLIYGRDKVAAGILQTSPEGATLHEVDQQLLAAGTPDAFAVTIEPEGGRPQPTGPIVLVGAVPKT